MSSDWREVTLEEVTTLLGDGLHGTPNYDDSGDYYFINGRNLSEGKIIIDEKTKRANEEEYLKYKKDLNDRTILVSINGTLGNIAFYNDENVFLGKSACYFNVNDEVEKEFIYYVLKNDVFQNHIDREATGTTIKNVSLKTMRGFSFKLPPLETQEKIASILGSIDQKIDLNQQTNETLKAMAQAIFKSWFVDFDPVRAKIEAASAGHDPNRAAMAAISGISLEQDWDEIEATLDQKLSNMSEEQRQQLTHTAQLFPDELEESEIGEVPTGWGVNGFDSLADMDNSSVSPSDYPEKLWKHHSFPAFDESKLPIEELGNEIKSRKYLVQKNAVLVSKLNPRFERTWAPKIDDSDSNICSTEFMQFVPKEDGGRGYIYFLVRSLPFQQGIKQRVTGSTGSRQRAKPKQVAKMEVLIPNTELRNIYSTYANNILAKIQNNIHENKELASLRETLLPQLISGDVGV